MEGRSAVVVLTKARVQGAEEYVRPTHRLFPLQIRVDTLAQEIICEAETYTCKVCDNPWFVVIAWRR